MRKIIFFVVSFYSLMLLLVACGNGEDALYEQLVADDGLYYIHVAMVKMHCMNSLGLV